MSDWQCANYISCYTAGPQGNIYMLQGSEEKEYIIDTWPPDSVKMVTLVKIAGDSEVVCCPDPLIVNTCSEEIKKKKTEKKHCLGTTPVETKLFWKNNNYNNNNNNNNFYSQKD